MVLMVIRILLIASGADMRAVAGKYSRIHRQKSKEHRPIALIVVSLDSKTRTP